MLLVVDSGNTNVVFAVYEGEEKRGQWRASSDPRRTPDEYAVWLTQLLDIDGFKPAQIDAAIISNVVPAALRNLRVLCQRYFKVEPLVVEEKSIAYGIPVRLDRPEQVGADRIANAVGAFARYGGPLIVVDFGTATTFDIIGADGGYDGGVIAPGINLSMDALYGAAARLPRIAVEKPQKVIGSDTVSAMQSGVFWGYIGLIEGLISRIQGEYGGDLKVVATGGLAPLFTETTAFIQESDADMTLRGLVLLYNRNAER